MYLDFFVSDDSVAGYDVHRKTTFFRGASGASLPFAQFSIFCNKNLGKYCSNVTLLYGNWLNKLTLSLSPKKILKHMPFFHWINLTPPPPLRLIYNEITQVLPDFSSGSPFDASFSFSLWWRSNSIAIAMAKTSTLI